MYKKGDIIKQYEEDSDPRQYCYYKIVKYLRNHDKDGYWYRVRFICGRNIGDKFKTGRYYDWWICHHEKSGRYRKWITVTKQEMMLDLL